MRFIFLEMKKLAGVVAMGFNTFGYLLELLAVLFIDNSSGFNYIKLFFINIGLFSTQLII